MHLDTITYIGIDGSENLSIASSPSHHAMNNDNNRPPSAMNSSARPPLPSAPPLSPASQRGAPVLTLQLWGAVPLSQTGAGANMDRCAKTSPVVAAAGVSALKKVMASKDPVFVAAGCLLQRR